MSAVWDIYLNVKINDETKIIKTLNKKIEDDVGVDYSLERHKNEGNTPDTFDGLMRIFLAGWRNNPFEVENLDNGFICYRNSFNASYGWGGVMESMWEAMKEYVDPMSEFICECY